jgi:hypothetical protein
MFVTNFFFLLKIAFKFKPSIHNFTRLGRPYFSSPPSPVQTQGVKEAEQAEGTPVPTVKEEQVFSLRGFLVR